MDWIRQERVDDCAFSGIDVPVLTGVFCWSKRVLISVIIFFFFPDPDERSIRSDLDLDLLSP
jgi:hypothetical protein